MKEFVISEKEAGQRMDKYLFKVLDRAPRSFVYKMLRKKNIVLNGKKAAGQEILKPADAVRIYLADDTFAKFASALPGEAKTEPSGGALTEAGHRDRAIPLKIVYEDQDILVIHKPAGMLSQKADAGDYSANERIIGYLLESGALTRAELRTFRPSVCNRLDRNTSGLLIAGKTVRGLQEMSALLKSRSVKKFYRTLVSGIVESPRHLTGYLVKDHKTNQVEISQEPGGDWIETAYRPLAYFGNGTLLEVHLITGRSHQIRAHLASEGYPILGDGKYGDRKLNQKLYRETGIRGQLLCACRMEFPDGKVIETEAPQEFRTAEHWLKQAAGLPKKIGT